MKFREGIPYFFLVVNSFKNGFDVGIVIFDLGQHLNHYFFIVLRHKMVARRLAVRQARVRFSARHHREVFSTEHRSDEEMERGLCEWRRINVLYECDCMNVCYKNMKSKQKEWHHATKHLQKWF
jgi:hypothetical protein